MSKILINLKKFYKISPTIIKDIGEKDLLSQAASLSYYCALSLAPFIVLTLTIFSFLGPETEQAFIAQVKETIGGNASDAVLLIIDTAKDNKEIRGLSGILSILTLLISASAVFSQLKTTVVAIFSEKTACDVEPKEQSWKDFLKEKIFSIGMMISFIFISLISLMLSSVLPFLMHAGEGIFWQSFNFIISLGIYASVFFLVFYYVSNKKVKKHDAWIGGVIAAILFVLGRTLISVYLVNSAVGSSYGAAGSLIVLLVWVYYSSFTIFVSGVITNNLRKMRTIPVKN